MITPTRQLFKWQEPEIIAQALIDTWGEAGFIWLDGDGSAQGKWITLTVDPIEQICCRGLPENKKASNPFESLKNLKQGHWTGWLSYEAAAWLEPCNPWKEDSMATLWIGSHDPVLKFDLTKQQLWLEGCHPNRFEKFASWLKNNPKLNSKYNKEYKALKKNSKGIPLDAWQWHTNKVIFRNNVDQIKDLIAKGDIFQANLTACCSTSLDKENLAIDLYHKLRIYSPAPFSGIIIGAGQANNEAIISASPERFLKVLPTGEVESRPIKGTRPRHSDSLQDAAMAVDLVCSPKDRAENVMIVDLLRNDLGRVCKPGSINVPQLVGIESFQHVHHLTSVVKGSLKEGSTWLDLLKASWPGGSISGAPKLRACQRLYELEPMARGPYCGSFINLTWNGTFDSNILIRSILLQGKTLRANAGCGIVADSDANSEAQELSWKLMPLLKALQ